jgi:electron transfer flavoprotein alpha subunit
MARILVYAELDQGRLMPVSLELLARARDLGEAEAVALGPGARGAAVTLGEHGARRVLVNEDPAFADYLAQPATDCLAALVRAEPPAAVLFAFTPDSREVAGRLAARLGTGVIAGATDVDIVDGVPRARIPYFGGAKLATVRANTSPALILVRPKSYEPSPVGGQAEVVEVSAEIADGSRRARVRERKVEAGDGVKLEDAGVVVSGGRGLGGPENFRLVEELAAALGGAAGASRAIVDAGWVPYALQIGQTGKTVKPGVYIAAGISGAMQHTVGMKGSRMIVAINKDADAPILKMADLGVVGDALKILPKLTDAVKARRHA